MCIWKESGWIDRLSLVYSGSAFSDSINQYRRCDALRRGKKDPDSTALSLAKAERKRDLLGWIHFSLSSFAMLISYLISSNLNSYYTITSENADTFYLRFV